MATWKKVSVSGSAISQFNNDAGYLTSGTLQVPNGFSTGSFGGTDILAESTSGSFNIVSGSGAGLKITADAGTRTATFTLEAIPNSSLANSTISGKALGTNLDDLTVDDSTLALNTGTTYNGSAARTINVKAGGITTTEIADSLGTIGVNSFTGSFSGSFKGDVDIDLADLTQGTGITSFTYDGNSTATVSIKNADNLTDNTLSKWDDGNGQFVDSSLTDNGTTITGTTSIQLTGASSNLSGSFSGSFEGDGSGLTGITADTLANSLVDGNGISDFTFDGSAGATVTVQADSTTGGNVKPVSVTANGVGLDVDTIDGTGLSANGSGLLDVDYGSTAGTAVEGNTTITLTQTSGEIDITGTAAQALGGGPSYTIGLADTITGDRTFSNDIIIGGDLTVQGTASFQSTQELLVADRFVLFASGSGTAGDGGIVVQQGTQNVGELFAFDSGATRWGLTGSFDATNTAYTPDAFMAAVVEGADADPDNAPARYAAKGNIFVGTDEGIWIYS